MTFSSKFSSAPSPISTSIDRFGRVYTLFRDQLDKYHLEIFGPSMPCAAILPFASREAEALIKHFTEAFRKAFSDSRRAAA